MKILCLRISVLCLLFLRLAPCSWSAQAVLEQILDNGPRENRINLVFLSEGFMEEELDAFVYHARNYLGGLLATPPFDDYMSYLNAFVVRVASAESGSDHPSAMLKRDTYFNSSYGNLGQDRLIEIPPNSYESDFQSGHGKVQALLKTFSFEHAIPILIVNDPEYGGSGDGSGRALTIVSLNNSGVRLMLHEFGHTLASLGDEYVYESLAYLAQESPNTTREYRRDFIPWHDWIDHSTPIPTPTSGRHADEEIGRAHV